MAMGSRANERPADMPLGVAVSETGTLNLGGNEYLLRRDDGGRWRLDLAGRCARAARLLVGQRVCVAGRRVGFDIVDVTSLERSRE